MIVRRRNNEKDSMERFWTDSGCFDGRPADARVPGRGCRAGGNATGTPAAGGGFPAGCQPVDGGSRSLAADAGDGAGDVCNAASQLGGRDICV